jgi:hypothetical protein
MTVKCKSRVSIWKHLEIYVVLCWSSYFIFHAFQGVLLVKMKLKFPALIFKNFFWRLTNNFIYFRFNDFYLKKMHLNFLNILKNNCQNVTFDVTLMLILFEYLHKFFVKNEGVLGNLMEFYSCHISLGFNLDFWDLLSVLLHASKKCKTLHDKIM